MGKWRIRRKFCYHDQNLFMRLYDLPDGTPMVQKICECGWKDEGHIYGDSYGFTTIIVYIGGKKVFDGAYKESLDG